MTDHDEVMKNFDRAIAGCGLLLTGVATVILSLANPVVTEVSAYESFDGRTTDRVLVADGEVITKAGVPGGYGYYTWEAELNDNNELEYVLYGPMDEAPEGDSYKDAPRVVAEKVPVLTSGTYSDEMGITEDESGDVTVEYAVYGPMRETTNGYDHPETSRYAEEPAWGGITLGAVLSVAGAVIIPRKSRRDDDSDEWYGDLDEEPLDLDANLRSRWLSAVSDIEDAESVDEEDTELRAIADDYLPRVRSEWDSLPASEREAPETYRAMYDSLNTLSVQAKTVRDRIVSGRSRDLALSSEVITARFPEASTSFDDIGAGGE